MSAPQILDERGQRIGRNEALFREVNERLGEVNETFSTVTDVMEIVCECGDLDCARQLSIRPAEYEHVRSDPRWFVVVPGHAIGTIETLVARHSNYEIVQKRPGAPAAVAEATDPRS